MVKNALIRLQAARDTRLGELLLRRGIIDATELRAMLSLQAELRAANGSGVLAHRYPLGRLLAETGVIDEQTFSRVALGSRRRLTAATLAGVALSAGAAAPAVAGDTANVKVAATVLARASIDSQRLPRELAISTQDIERGYIDVQEPVQIGLRSNHPAGVMVGFTPNSAQLTAVDVQQDGSARAAGSTVFVPQQQRGLQHHNLLLKLRVKLAPAAIPGRIAFPLSVSLTPA